MGVNVGRFTLFFMDLFVWSCRFYCESLKNTQKQAKSVSNTSMIRFRCHNAACLLAHSLLRRGFQFQFFVVLFSLKVLTKSNIVEYFQIYSLFLSTKNCIALKSLQIIIIILLLKYFAPRLQNNTNSNYVKEIPTI